MLHNVYIITGANTGLGFECARVLAKLPETTVVIACRDATKGEASAQKLRADGGDAMVIALDLSSLESARAFADHFGKLGAPFISGLVCNAGIQEVGPPSKTKEGFESTFGVNHLGHFLLSQLMLPFMRENGRIIFVTSGVHDPDEKTGLPPPRYLNAEQIAHDFEPGMRAGQRRYSTSKLCNIYHVYEFSRVLRSSNDPRLRSIRVNAFDPGMMPGTGLARQYPAPLQFAWNYILPALRLFKRNVHSPETSGKRLADLASDPDLQASGKYFSDGREKRSSDLSYDRKNAKELWDSSAVMAGLNSTKERSS